WDIQVLAETILSGEQVLVIMPGSYVWARPPEQQSSTISGGPWFCSRRWLSLSSSMILARRMDVRPADTSGNPWCSLGIPRISCVLDGFSFENLYRVLT